MARSGILLSAMTFSLSVVAALVTFGFTPAVADRKKNDNEQEMGMTAQRYAGLWFTADGYIRHELLDNGRYVEARGTRERAYEGRYEVSGQHIEYWDDTGFTADGDFVDADTLHHGGMVLRRR